MWGREIPLPTPVNHRRGRFEPPGLTPLQLSETFSIDCTSTFARSDSEISRFLPASPDVPRTFDSLLSGEEDDALRSPLSASVPLTRTRWPTRSLN